MPAKKPAIWNYETDVVVLGTGAAALVSAILAHDHGAEVIILEKAAQIGGTTAFSGGVPWIPMNRHMKELGISDSKEQALTYLRRLTGGKEPNPDLLEVFVDNAHQMLDYLYEHTPLRFSIPAGFPEYYSNIAGSSKEGRSLDPLPFSLNELGEWKDKVRNNPVFPPLTLEEGGAIGGIDYMKIAERMEENVVTMGRSLIASLFKACLDRGIQTFTETPGKELVLNEQGDVIGLRAEQGEENIYFGTRKGVVLASGGFEWNQELVKAFLKGYVTHPLSPQGNTGDGLIMAMEAGAALANMNEAWWYPAMQDPTIEYEDRILNIIGNGRNGANTIMVNKHAKRFVNEGTAYMDLPKAFHAYDPVALEWPNEPPVWMIFDSQLKNKEMVVTVLPDDPAPDWMNQADTIHELAIQIGLDPYQLEATIHQFNQYAKEGYDPDFGRGTADFEHFSTRGGGVSASLGPIEQGPFYAVQIFAGTLGTNGGPRINEDGQVMNLHGRTITGLYAAGNAAMGVFGGTYPSAGGTIGPAMTFGYLAGKAVASAKNKEIQLT